LTAWVLAKDDTAKVSPKQPERKDVTVNQTPLMLALAFEAGDPKDPALRDGLKAMLALVLGDQDKDGAWRLGYVWEPHGSTPDVMTAWALLALTAPNAPDLGAAGKAARERGLKWLAAAVPADTPQSDGLRLVLYKRLGRPPADWEPLRKKLLARQHADGGWGQAAGMKSDAFATGQALVAVAEAGCNPDDPAVAKARGFLVRSQRADGSWEMGSRPGGPGGKSAKNLAPITLVGTAWAVQGLIRSAPAVARSEGADPRAQK
jgi:squalene cyclase